MGQSLIFSFVDQKLPLQQYGCKCLLSCRIGINFEFVSGNTGDAIDYGQNKRQSLGDLVNSTLELLERHGGPDAFINIKYMVPTYESCILN